MTVNRLKACITNTVINYYNYQVGRKPSKASKAGLNPVAVSLRERDEYQNYEKLSVLVNQISDHLYDNRHHHLQCLLTIFKAVQDAIENPSDSIKAQALSIQNLLERYFLSIITLYSSDSDIQLTERIILNTLKAYAYGVNTGTSSFGTTLEDCMLHPFSLNILSSKDDVKFIAEKISQDLLDIVHRNAKEQDSEKEKQDSSLIQENTNLKQQLSAKDEVIASLQKENQKLKEKPCSITDAFSFYSSATLPENKDEQEVVTATL